MGKGGYGFPFALVLIFKIYSFFILYSLVFCLCVCLCECVRYPGTEIMDSCELPCGCWELNPGPLEEQPSLQPPWISFWNEENVVELGKAVACTTL